MLIRELSKEYDALFERKKKEQGRLEAVWAGDWRGDNSSNSSVLSVHNLQQHSAVFTRLLLHDKLTSSVQQIMETCGEVINDSGCMRTFVYIYLSSLFR